MFLFKTFKFMEFDYNTSKGRPKKGPRMNSLCLPRMCAQVGTAKSRQVMGTFHVLIIFVVSTQELMQLISGPSSQAPSQLQIKELGRLAILQCFEKRHQQVGTISSENYTKKTFLLKNLAHSTYPTCSLLRPHKKKTAPPVSCRKKRRIFVGYGFILINLGGLM